MNIRAMTRQEIVHYVSGGIVITVALSMLGLGVHESVADEDFSLALASLALASALVLLIVGTGMLRGERIKGASFSIGKVKFSLDYFSQAIELAQSLKPRILDDDVLHSRADYAKDKHLPGEDAPRFSAVVPSVAADIMVRPSAYPMTPMYLLDNAYRILDWNEAFSLAFDRTMEGRKGRGVLEWTYFLDNYEEVLDHGMKVFGEANELPRIDVETIRYTNLRYGKLAAVKRAYQIPDDDGACLGWLVTLDLTFVDESQEQHFQRDLISLLGLDQMWSEYAISYDKVLASTEVYEELLSDVIGKSGGLIEIGPKDRVLDLGAGTGNVTERLMQDAPEREVVAVENNRVMLEILRAKCRHYLKNGEDGPGVVAIKQDITSLYGLDDDYFDHVILNNVLYAVADADSCLREVHRVLKPGGEVRLSGPRNDSKVDALFERIGNDLEAAGTFEDLETDFAHVLQINELRLKPMLNRWSTADMKARLLKAGFSEIVHATEDVYAGQSMLISARK